MLLTTDTCYLTSFVLFLGPEDIANGNLKLILGLLWTLIQRFQIINMDTTHTTVKVSPKKALLAWVQACLPQFKVNNFTKDWSDGILLSNLINYLHPGLIPHCANLDPSYALDNVTYAMEVAYNKFGIPKLIDPEGLCHMPEELSVMTYLSYFCGPDSIGYQSLLEWVRRQIPASNVTNFSSDWKDGSALCALVNNYAPNALPSAESLKDLTGLGKLQVAMDTAEKLLGIKPMITAEQFIDPDIDRLFVMIYITHFQHAEHVEVKDTMKVYGTGITGGAVGDENSFVVQSGISLADTSKNVTVEVVGPDDGLITVEEGLASATGATLYRYVPKLPGVYQVSVTADGKHLPGSPYMVPYTDVPQPEKCIILEPGIEKAQVGKWSEFIVDCNAAGPGNLSVDIQSPSGSVEHEIEPLPNSQYKIRFHPTVVGAYVTSVEWTGSPICNSPFTCQVSNPAKCIASGTGISGAKLGEPVEFAVSTVGTGPGSLEAVVYGPKGEKVQLEVEQTDDKAVYMYTPESYGSYLIDVKWDGFPIKGSPFRVKPAAAFNINNVSISQALPKKSKAGDEVSFCVNVKDAGHAPLSASTMSPSGKVEICEIEEKEEGIYIVEFVPQEAGEYQVTVNYGGTELRQSQLHLNVYDPEKVVVDVQSISRSTYKANSTVEFVVGTGAAGNGIVTASAKGPRGFRDVTVSRLGDGNWKVMYNPDCSGMHLLDVYYNNDAVLAQPIVLNIDPPQDMSITASPTAEGTYEVEKPYEFRVTSPDGSACTDISAYAYGTKTNSLAKTTVIHNPDGSASVQFVARYPDEYQLEITTAGKHIPGSPYSVLVGSPSKPSQIKCGDPVVPLKQGRPIELTLDASEAGSGPLTAHATGEKCGWVPVNIEENPPGIYCISFTPPSSDKFTLNTFWAKEHVPGSPFTIPYNEIDVEPPYEVVFESDATEPGFLTAAVVGRECGPIRVDIVHFESGKYRLGIDPPQGDVYDLKIVWNGEEVDGSPFELDLRQHGKMKSTLAVTPGGSGNLAASVRGRHVGDVPVEVSQLTNGDYLLYFAHTKRDTYDLKTVWNGSEMRGSPFTINIHHQSN